MIGASGGAKLLGIAHLDRYLFSTFLAGSSHPMSLYGSSIGSWRHAALASRDPLSAITRLQERYLAQAWDERDERHPRQIVDSLCEWVLDDLLTQELIEDLLDHPRFSTHIVTARGRGLNNRETDALLGLGMGLSAVGNLLHRGLLARGFQRVVFSHGELTGFAFRDFDTAYIKLTRETVRPALTASGSIPFLMSGVRDIGLAPPGQYWDGGVIDYHFDLDNLAGDGLVLYPHFSNNIIKGWFDKKLPWRQNRGDALDRVVVIAPSADYLATLPGGRIPDRNDFRRYSQEVRQTRWREAVDASTRLAEALHEVINHPDPLARVIPA